MTVLKGRVKAAQRMTNKLIKNVPAGLAKIVEMRKGDDGLVHGIKVEHENLPKDVIGWTCTAAVDGVLLDSVAVPNTDEYEVTAKEESVRCLFNAEGKCILA